MKLKAFIISVFVGVVLIFGSIVGVSIWAAAKVVEEIEKDGLKSIIEDIWEGEQDQ